MTSVWQCWAGGKLLTGIGFHKTAVYCRTCDLTLTFARRYALKVTTVATQVSPGRETPQHASFH